jgi:hypothetical protein
MYWNVLECIEEHESDDARMDARLVEGKRARCIGMYWSVLRSTRATMLGWMLTCRDGRPRPVRRD